MPSPSRSLLAWLLLGAFALTPACAKKEPSASVASAATAPTPSAARRFPLKGVIVEIQSAASALLVKHEPIPDFMPAMTMLFKVDAATLATVKKGDAIAATLVERDGDFWLIDVHPAHP